MRTLAGLALLTLSIGGCQTAPSEACPREVEYTLAQQREAAAELQAMPKTSILYTFMADYVRLRDQSRACRGR